MRFTALFVVLALFGTAFSACDGQLQTAQIVFEVPFANFTWQSQADQDYYFNNHGYENCTINGVKIDANGDIYVTIPRWKSGVPGTVNKVIPTNDGGYILDPYPSWELNSLTSSDSIALKSVLGIEIDTQNRMWILDQGKVVGQPAAPNATKLVIWDINSNSLVQVHYFTTSEISYTDSFLNDLVVDPSKWVAYIADSGVPVNGTPDQPLYGGLIVYSFETNTAVRVLSQHWSVQDDPSVWVVVAGELVLPTTRMRTGADGIALTCDYSTLYYCPLTSRTLFSIPTSYLQQSLTSPSVAASLPSYVTVVGNKTSASDGLIAGDRGNLYMSALERNAILKVSSSDLANLSSTNTTSNGLPAAIEVLAEDDQRMIWQDTLAFDGNGFLYWTTNHLNRFETGSLNFTQINYRLWRAYVGENAYIGGCASAPRPIRHRGRAFPVAGVVAGGCIGGVLIIACLSYLWWRKRQPKKSSPDSSYSMMS